MKMFKPDGYYRIMSNAQCEFFAEICPEFFETGIVRFPEFKINEQTVENGGLMHFGVWIKQVAEKYRNRLI